jgi:hypothetical protein
MAEKDISTEVGEENGCSMTIFKPADLHDSQIGGFCPTPRKGSIQIHAACAM